MTAADRNAETTTSELVELEFDCEAGDGVDTEVDAVVAVAVAAADVDAVAVGVVLGVAATDVHLRSYGHPGRDQDVGTPRQAIRGAPATMPP